MFMESLVVFSCSIGHCQEAVDSYNHYNPEPMKMYRTVLKEAEKTGKRVANKYVGSAVVNTIVPVAGWMYRQEAAFSVRENTTMKIKFEDNYKKFTVGVAYSF